MEDHYDTTMILWNITETQQCTEKNIKLAESSEAVIKSDDHDVL